MKRAGCFWFESHIAHLSLFLAVSAAGIVPRPLQAAEQNANDAAPVSPAAGHGQAAPVAINGLSSLETELLALLHTNFATPEGRQKAMLQWNATHVAELKRELDARHMAERPVSEARKTEIDKQFAKTLNDQVKAGKIGKLEAEFMGLTRSPFNSNEQRGVAVEQWRAKKGAALVVERETRRSQEAPRLAAMLAEGRGIRHDQVQQALKNGNIGPQEAKLQQLHDTPDAYTTAGQETIRKWIDAHGTELKTEVEARNQRMSVKATLPVLPNDSPPRNSGPGIFR